MKFHKVERQNNYLLRVLLKMNHEVFSNKGGIFERCHKELKLKIVSFYSYFAPFRWHKFIGYARAQERIAFLCGLLFISKIESRYPVNSKLLAVFHFIRCACNWKLLARYQKGLLSKRLFQYFNLSTVLRRHILENNSY